READERGDVHADAPRVQHRVIPGDDARVLALLHALRHRRRGEPDVLADLRQRQPTILLQEGQDVAVDGIEIELRLAVFHKVESLRSRTDYWSRGDLSRFRSAKGEFDQRAPARCGTARRRRAAWRPAIPATVRSVEFAF